jgi:pimeloyl-ACP methyl ester carboxylesterase
MNFVLVHGGWCGGWWMSRLAKALRRRGFEAFAPTLTGLGEREHLASPDVGLTTHIRDVLAVLHYEDLRDVVLVGHSYGGAVATGVADRARDRIQRLIYMDAFVLRDGQSVRDVCPPGMEELLTGLAQQLGDGWRAPSPFTMEQFGVSTPEDIAWNERGLAMHPLKTLVEPVTLHSEPLPFPVSYVRCTERSLGLFDPFAARAQAAGWDYREVPWTHAAPAVVPDECAELLIDIAGSEVSRAPV